MFQTGQLSKSGTFAQQQIEMDKPVCQGLLFHPDLIVEHSKSLQDKLAKLKIVIASQTINQTIFWSRRFV